MVTSTLSTTFSVLNSSSDWIVTKSDHRVDEIEDVVGVCLILHGLCPSPQPFEYLAKSQALYDKYPTLRDM